MKEVIFPIILLVSFVVGGCGMYGNQNKSPNQAPNQQNQQQGMSTVTIQNYAFNPQTLTIKKGTTVTWTNQDSMNHQIKSNNFNSGPLSQGQTYSYAFKDAGTYDYSCGIHPFMRGTIVVQ